jgi:hypothetical protein
MSERFTSVNITPAVRDKARVTKAKLDVTWPEFIELAAEELDPDTED